MAEQDLSLADGTTPRGPAEPGEDRLIEARIALDGVDDMPLDRRGEVFERVHRAVVDELRQLELG